MKFSGMEGMLKEELRNVLDRGGRFIHSQCAFSILIMTFRRPSSIHFIRPGEGAVLKSLKYPLFTLLYGWWGFPWGPIYSIQSLFHNVSGGKDVTPEICKAVESLEDAQLAALPKASPLMGYLGILLPLLLVSWFVFREEKQDAARATVPGYAAFKRADDSIARYHGKTGFGNSVKAAAGAIRFATAIKGFRDLAISGLHPLTHREAGGSFDWDEALSYGTLPKVFGLEGESRTGFLRSYTFTYLKEEMGGELVTYFLAGP